MNAIELSDLTKTFKRKGKVMVEAVKGLTLSVESGEIFGFLGPNGAGKSTTIKILMGLLHPSAGRATIRGIDVGSHHSRKHVGYLPENPSFYDYLTAEEYLVFVCKTFGLTSALTAERVESNLKLLDLWDARKRPMRGYSKGMVQRLGLAQTLIHDPDVYVLDEPMSGLDPVGRALVKEIIIDLKAKGKCVFFSTHITSDVETVCDRVGIIVEGTLQRVERVDTILTEGIVGYHIKVRMPGAAQQQTVEVPKAELMKFTAETHAAGGELTLIEPKRKNLEAFFLDIVRGKQC
jgi:ABC-2 type transport system ATP-binding protein